MPGEKKEGSAKSINQKPSRLLTAVRNRSREAHSSSFAHFLPSSFFFVSNDFHSDNH